MRHSTRPTSAGQLYSELYHKRVDTRPVGTTAQLVCTWIEGGRLGFANDQDRRQAFADGVFLLTIPAELDITAADQFASEFYRGDASPYGHFKNIRANQFDDELLGFHQRVDQIEQFLLERRFWSRYYPTEITRIAEKMTELSRLILGAALDYAGIPKHLWPQATGCCSQGAGAYHLTFNHYRAQLPEAGLSSHKDDGFLTILRTTQPGLEVNRLDRWESVKCAPDTFVINFGLSMEWLTAHCDSPVAAILHRVTHQAQDRISFGHFSSSNFIPHDHGIFSYYPTRGLERICDVRELINNNDQEIYQGTVNAGGAQNENTQD